MKEFIFFTNFIFGSIFIQMYHASIPIISHPIISVGQCTHAIMREKFISMTQGRKAQNTFL